MVKARPDLAARLRVLLSLTMASYAFGEGDVLRVTVQEIADLLSKCEAQSVNAALAATGHASPSGVRALMWLWKFDLIQVIPPRAQQSA